MNIFEKLSNDERAHIADYIESYAGFGAQGIDMKSSLEHILRFWNNNKADLFKVFGGELILTKNVSFNKPNRLIENDVADMLDWGGKGRNFYLSFDRWASTQGSLRYDLRSLMYCETLAKNIYAGPSFEISLPDGHTLAVNTGCKVSRLLGKIASNFNLEGYEDFRLAHSLCLNQKTLRGELCLSIHPLDYMTMSDNNCGWDSCMSWQNPGDYRLGTVEMLNSPVVVVAYLKSSEDMSSCCGWNWNSKKWRQLYIVTPHMITGIRQYPYSCDELNGITLKWLRDLAETNGVWGPYEDTAVELRNNCQNVIASLDREVYISCSTHFMYNDFYNNHLSYISASIPDHYELCFSGETECMVCGADISEYDEGCIESSSLTCNSCEHVYWCDECGERVDDSECYYVDGQRVCRYCYEEHYKTCPLCEEMHHEEYFFPVYIRENEDDTAEHLSYVLEVCEECLNNRTFVKLFGEAKTIPYGRYNTKYVVDIDNITLEGLEYFDIWYEDDYDRLEARIKSRAQLED